jgi:DNA gyrase subunit A
VDISNQSSKEGIRIVLDLKRDADVENLTNMLYKKTKLEDAFGVNMLAVADGRPETLSLKQVIEHHVDFVFDVTTRKYTTLLNKEQEKKEIQEGLIKACDVIDLIIEILRGSKNREQVKKCLVDGVTEGIRFKGKSSEKAAQKLHFSEKQAAAILDMRLYKLIGLEIEALQADYAETMKNIAIYEDILNNYDSMAEVIMKELDQIKKEYGTKRRTVIENAEEVVYEEKKMEEMEVTFLMDRFGYMRTIDKSAYERNKEAANAENKYVFNCMNTDKICIFTDNGKMHSIKVADIPLVRFRDKGTPADNLSNYDSAQERMLYVAPLASVKAIPRRFAILLYSFPRLRDSVRSSGRSTHCPSCIAGGAIRRRRIFLLASPASSIIRFRKRSILFATSAAVKSGFSRRSFVPSITRSHTEFGFRCQSRTC